MEELNKWLEHWEPTWLFLVLALETLISGAILRWTVKEYFYDYEKDVNKRHKKRKEGSPVVVDSVAGGDSPNQCQRSGKVSEEKGPGGI